MIGNDVIPNHGIVNSDAIDEEGPVQPVPGGGTIYNVTIGAWPY